MTTIPSEHLLSKAIRDRIDQWVLRYPADQKRSGVFEALRLVQQEHGFLNEELMNAVADYLGMPHIAVYEVATFYSMYYLKPVGKHVVDLCTNISCSLNGADELLAHLKKRLNIDVNETTADGKFTLKEVECLGACITAPVCQVGKKYHVSLTPEKIDAILAELSETGAVS
jgi:NADH-quinone oxidoreductase subunit E